MPKKKLKLSINGGLIFAVFIIIDRFVSDGSFYGFLAGRRNH
ncbi:MAG TPA: hypothetical protein VGK25_02135 [Ignavibacteria bacterium]|jgi:hypothetical protein